MTVKYQAVAAQDECPHHHCGDVRFGGQEPTELRWAQPCDAAVAAHAGADNHRSVVEDSQFPGELVLLVGVHNAVDGAAGFVNFDESVEDEEEVDTSIAALEQHSAARKPLHNAEGNDSLGLISCQPWEGLCLPCIRVGRIQRRALDESSR
jgi:hypothetical protein